MIHLILKIIDIFIRKSKSFTVVIDIYVRTLECNERIKDKKDWRKLVEKARKLRVCKEMRRVAATWFIFPIILKVGRARRVVTTHK